RPEVRYLRSDKDRKQLVLHEMRRGHEPKAEDENHRSDDGPLLATRHTVTPQRERNAPISARGSRAPKIACPATNVSAPACQTLSMVSRLMPPSTSSAASLRSSSNISRARRILSMAYGMNSCPPNPGFTDMMSKRSISGRISHTDCNGVAGFSATPAR